MHKPYTVNARIYRPADWSDLTALLGRAPTRGHVGVALSGGGSRAAAASIGVLRGLHALGLLGHVRAISSVSGAAWTAIPFTFADRRFADADLLGPLVERIERLRPGTGPHGLDVMPAHYLGAQMTRMKMSLISLALDAASDARLGVSTTRLWNRQIAHKLLEPYALALFSDRDHRPLDFFAPDQATIDRLQAAHPALPRRAYPVRAEPTLPRPHLIVGAGMRVPISSEADTLMPVQFTPHFSGVLGRLDGALPGFEIGGAAISSYAAVGRRLDSTRSGDTIDVELDTPLSLSTVAGITSAAFADSFSDKRFHSFTPHLPIFDPDGSGPSSVVGQFVDGGSLECTGVAALLAYPEIDALIAMVSPPGPMRVEGEQVVVDRQIAALFGYREWTDEQGWRLYSEPGDGNPDYARAQVFESSEFAGLLAEMAARFRAGEPVVVERTHRVVTNARHGVSGGRSVRVVWMLQAPCPRFASALHPVLRAALGPTFPNVHTTFTAMPRPTLMLLGHFAAWQVLGHQPAIEGLFDGP